MGVKVRPMGCGGERGSGRATPRLDVLFFLFWLRPDEKCRAWCTMSFEFSKRVVRKCCLLAHRPPTDLTSIL